MENTISTLEKITSEDGKLSMELRAKVDRLKELFVELNIIDKIPSMENTISNLEKETRSKHEFFSIEFKAEVDRFKESLVKPNNINKAEVENTIFSFEKLSRIHREQLIELIPKVDDLTESFVKLKNIRKEKLPPPSEANFRFVLKQARIIKKGESHINVGKEGLIDTLEIPFDGSVKIYLKGTDGDDCNNIITGDDLRNAIPYLLEYLKRSDSFGLPLERNCRHFHSQGQDTSDQE